MMDANRHQKQSSSWRETLHTIIFEADTPGGKLFDVILIVSIIMSILVVMLDSVAWIRATYGHVLNYVEWFFTILFSIEYILRILCVTSPASYMKSFFGIIDILAILPSYLSIIIPGTQYFLVIRVLRVLRIFRVLKFVQYVSEARLLMQALRASRRKITVFIFVVMTMVIILGSFMYVIEGPEHGFTSIPTAIYWAIITFTTVGYGDITPMTALGQTLSAVVMILGYSIIVVPTGLVTVELSRTNYTISTQACPNCGAEGHDIDASYCKYCGTKL